MPSKPTNSERELITPPESLLANNPLQWFRFIGPGAVVASCTIGSGEVIFSTRGGAIFGYNILWIFLLASLVKWVFCYSSMRHMTLSGAHPFERWKHLPGPHGWFPLFMFTIGLVCFPIWNSFLAGVLGTACTWMFGKQPLFAGNDTYCWATIALVLAMIVMLSGNYRRLESLQTGLVLIMLVCIVVAVFMLRPNILEILPGTFVPTVPTYPDWVRELKEFEGRTPTLEIMVYISAIGGGSFAYLSYLSFLRDKKWGLAHMGVASDELLEQIAAQKDHPARLWVRAAAIDTVTSFSLIAILSACFSILGTIVLAPDHVVPADEELLNHQANFMRVLSPWLVPLYKIAVFAAFLPILYGGPELDFRVIKEFLHSTDRFHNRFAEKKLRFAFIAWCLFGALILLWVSWWIKTFVDSEFSLVDWISPAGIYTGVLTCGFYCLANPWMDWKFLPPKLRMNWLLVGLNLIAGVLFTILGAKSLWDEWWYTDQRWHCFILLAVLAGFAMLLSVLFRRFLYTQPEHEQDIARR